MSGENTGIKLGPSLPFTTFLAIGVVFVLVGAVSTEWSEEGAGIAGLYNVCGCRDINESCRAGTGVKDVKDKVIPRATDCDSYTISRGLIYAAVIISFAWYVLAVSPFVGPYPKKGNGVEHRAGAYEWIFFVLNTLTFGLAVVGWSLWISLTEDNEKDHILLDNNPGFILFLTGSAMVFIPWVVWLIAFFNADAAENLATWDMVRIGRFWFTAAMLILFTSVVQPDWALIKVHEAKFVPNATGITNLGIDMNAVVAQDPLDNTLPAALAPLLSPPVGTEPASKALTLNLMGYCLCTNIKPSCNWRNATISDDKNGLYPKECETYETAQAFGWITVAFAIMTLLVACFMSVGGESNYPWLYFFGLLSVITGFAGVICVSTYSTAVDSLKPSPDVDGVGYILFIVGFVLVFVTGFIAACVWRFSDSMYTQIGPLGPETGFAKGYAYRQ